MSRVRVPLSLAVCVLAVLAGLAGSAEAAQLDARAESGDATASDLALLTRDAAGHVTVRATRIDTPLRIDGRLDEDTYSRIPAISDFIQVEPADGAPATQKTEFWILFDKNFLYVTARCWESHPDRMVVTEMRRDNTQIASNENFGFMLDTFHDKRTGAWYELNPIGGRIDAQITGDRQVNLDWNPVWDLKTGKFDGGWTVEAAIPFKSLRYDGARQQTWGINVRRIIRWKNEVSFIIRSGSELFVVYNEERDTRPSGFPMMKNKALIVKTNRLFRF